MHPVSSNGFRRRGFLSALLAIALLSPSVLAVALRLQDGTATGAAAVKKSTATLTIAEKKAASEVKLETIRQVTTSLSSKEFEGRGTAQPGADKAAAYLADRFTKLGLKPLGDNGTYLQPIKFKVADVLPESSVKVGDAVLKNGEDYVVLPPYTSERVDANSGLVFAGYGVVSPELKRDDLAVST